MKRLFLAIALMCAIAHAQTAIDLGGPYVKGHLPLARFTAGVAGQCLTTDSNGNTAWGSCSAGSGVFPHSLASAAHLWLNSYDATTGIFTQTRPDYSDLTGLPTLAANTTSTLHQFFTAYNSATGAFSKAQPDYSDLTGTPVVAATISAVAHKFLTSYSATTGLFTQAQPAYTDLTGVPAIPSTLASAPHKWFNSYDATTGLFTQTQPDYSDLTGVPATFAPSAHNLLSVAHGDVTAGTVARGDLITGQGASPTWSRLAKGAASQCLQMDGTATDIVWGACATGVGGGSGTVTSFSASALSPIFTTSVATATTTPALSFSLSTAAAHSFLGNNTASTAAPAYLQPASTDLADFSATAPSAAGQIPIFDGTHYIPGDPEVQGLAADGATTVLNPIEIGGYDTAVTPAIHRAIFLNGAPAGTEYGIVTRNVPSGTQAVSAASLPLPAGAATSAKQPALGTAGTPSADVLTVQGVASMTALKVDGSAVTQPVSGTVSVSNFPATQPVSGTVAATQSGTWTTQPPAATPILENALSTTVKTVSAGAAILDSYYCANPNTAAAYVQIFDISGAVTLGTSTPKWSIRIPPNDGAANLSGVNLNFATAIKIAATTTATGSTAPTTALDCNFGIR